MEYLSEYRLGSGKYALASKSGSRFRERVMGHVITPDCRAQYLCLPYFRWYVIGLILRRPLRSCNACLLNESTSLLGRQLQLNPSVHNFSSNSQNQPISFLYLFPLFLILSHDYPKYIQNPQHKLTRTPIFLRFRCIRFREQPRKYARRDLEEVYIENPDPRTTAKRVSVN